MNNAIAPEPIIELRAVEKHFAGRRGQDVQALHPTDLVIRAGEFFSLLGPSGCGKTTTLRIIAGFETPTTGELLIEGRAMSTVPPFKRPVNMVFQDYALFPHLSIYKNVEFGLRLKGIRPAERLERVRAALEMVRLGGLDDRMPSQLSGGQRQRVALARAIVNEPAVLLLDEPLGALDLKLRRAMQVELKGLQRKLGITFVYVTHDQEEALAMSDRIAVMNEGHVLQVGAPPDIYDRPATRFVADFVGEANVLRATIHAVEPGQLVLDLADQRLTVAYSANGVKPGQDVTLAVRPEKLALGPRQHNHGSVVLPGTLDEFVYLGHDTRFVVSLPGGQRVTVRMRNAGDAVEPVGPGAAVNVVVDNPADLRVLVQ